MNANRDRKAHPQPITFSQPWQAHDTAADVTPEERAELKQRLLRKSAFRDR